MSKADFPERRNIYANEWEERMAIKQKAKKACMNIDVYGSIASMRASYNFKCGFKHATHTWTEIIE